MTLASDKSMQIIEQDEKEVGAATVQLTTTTTACEYVWVGAPTASHTVGATNDGILLIGNASGGNADGGQVLTTDDHKGFIIPTQDASQLYVTGTAAGDVIEYQIWG